MNACLLHPTYFGSILQFSVMAKVPNITFEFEDNYQKQTYRNRQYIYGANGKLLLNIPVKHLHSGEGKQKYKEVKIEHNFNWQTNHWRSLEAAYRTSPFFEFYEDELRELYEQDFDYLIDFNMACLEAVCDCLQLDLSFKKTAHFQLPGETEKDITDYRNLVNAKQKSPVTLTRYNQVFQDKFGFIANLSILDLLFNEGTNALSYLEKLPLP